MGPRGITVNAVRPDNRHQQHRRPARRPQTLAEILAFPRAGRSADIGRGPSGLDRPRLRHRRGLLNVDGGGFAIGPAAQGSAPKVGTSLSGRVPLPRPSSRPSPRMRGGGGGDWGIPPSLRSRRREPVGPQGRHLYRGGTVPDRESPAVIGRGGARGLVPRGRSRRGWLASHADPAVRIVSLTSRGRGLLPQPGGRASSPRHPGHRPRLPTPTHGPRPQARRRGSGGRAEGTQPFSRCEFRQPAVRTDARVRGMGSGLRPRPRPRHCQWDPDTSATPPRGSTGSTPTTPGRCRQPCRAVAYPGHPGPVVPEPFGQWVIEDDFPQGPPPPGPPDGTRAAARNSVASLEPTRLKLRASTAPPFDLGLSGLSRRSPDHRGGGGRSALRGPVA